jgi:hypothetical protein
MNFSINWILGLFKKPQAEITVDPVDAAWPFPVVSEKKKPTVKKATTRKTVVKKAPAKKVVSKKKPLETHFTIGKRKAVKKAIKRLEKVK